MADTIDLSLLNDLRRNIDKWRDAYYNGTPEVSNDVYDAAIESLEEACPEDHRLAQVGAPPRSEHYAPVKHTAFMGSLKKAKDEGELNQWYRGGPLWASLKYDGASIGAYYTNGNLSMVATRGDNDEGLDVTVNASVWKYLPQKLSMPLTCCVRGEAIITVKSWLLLDPDPELRTNPRNIGTGVVNRKDGYQAEFVEFRAFGISGAGPATESGRFDLLKTLGFNPIPGVMCQGIGDVMAYYHQMLAIYGIASENSDYWADGVVITYDDVDFQTKLGISSGCPQGSRVLKWPAEGAQTTVEGVLITLGHTGAHIPTAALKPVKIAGTTISNVLLNNWDQIKELDIAVGDLVYVTKRGGIIPKVESVVARPDNRQPILEPTRCISCDEPLMRGDASGPRKSGAWTICTNPDCPGKSSGKVKRWIKSLGILGMGNVVLNGLVSIGVKTPADLYRLDPDKLADMAVGNRFGEDRAAAFLAEVEKTRTLTISEFLGSLGLPLLGKRRVIQIQEAGDKLGLPVHDLQAWMTESCLSDDGSFLLTHAEELGVKNMGATIYAGIIGARDVITDLLNYITVADPDTSEAPAPTGGKLEGKSFCFTGKLPSGMDRNSVHTLVIENGGIVKDKVAKGLTYLVMADPGSGSSKAVKAQKDGVECISEEQFRAMIA